MLKKIFFFIANLFWLLLFGWWSIIIICLIGIICCATFFLKPWGFSCFHLARGLLSPFGKRIIKHNLFNYQFIAHSNLRKNIGCSVWLILFGIISMVFFFLCVVVTVITIIFAPFGLQFLKIIRFLFNPVKYVCVPTNQAKTIKNEKNKLEIQQQRDAMMRSL